MTREIQEQTNDADTRCANPNCRCEVMAGERYCSAGCEDAEEGFPCTCGHTECQIAQADMT